MMERRVYNSYEQGKALTKLELSQNVAIVCIITGYTIMYIYMMCCLHVIDSSKNSR